MLFRSGQDDPGKVTWAPKVFEMAKDFGLVLLENGSLIDTAKGQAVPEGKRPMPPTSAEHVATLTRYTQAEAEGLVWRPDQTPTSQGDRGERIIGPGAQLGWDHGYTLDRYRLTGNAEFDPRGAVLFVQDGEATLRAGDAAVELGKGDTMTVPADLDATLSGHATVFAVRRG